MDETRGRDVAEIIRKVKHVQIVANRVVNDFMAGEYLSVFKGRGMEFDEVREYLPGDDIRSIDWNVTARTGTPYVKRFCEERELTILLTVDVSTSGLFGSGEGPRLDLLVEVAALLMFSALKNNDKVGLITFCDEVIEYLPPRKGKANVLHLIRQLVAAEPVARETNLEAALEFVSKVQKRRSVAFLMSDFLAPEARHAMAVCNKRHDLIAITVTDPREPSGNPCRSALSTSSLIASAAEVAWREGSSTRAPTTSAANSCSGATSARRENSTIRWEVSLTSTSLSSSRDSRSWTITMALMRSMVARRARRALSSVVLALCIASSSLTTCRLLRTR